MTSPSPTIVLVHGAFTDTAVWSRVTRVLEHAGYTVLAPTIRLRSLAADVSRLHDVLVGIEGPVLVAGHSYGGSVISDPAALTPQVSGLVFVAAFQQDRDETAGELNDKFSGSLIGPDTTWVEEDPEGSRLFLRPEHFAPVYAADLDPAASAYLGAHQNPIDPAALGETLSGVATWTRLPSWVLIATADRSIPTQAQRYMAARAGSTVVEVDSSHAVPLAHPDATARLIIDAARAES